MILYSVLFESHCFVDLFIIIAYPDSLPLLHYSDSHPSNSLNACPCLTCVESSFPVLSEQKGENCANNFSKHLFRAAHSKNKMLLMVKVAWISAAQSVQQV